MELDRLQPLQQMKHWQHSMWRRIDLRLPLSGGALLLILFLASFLPGVHWVPIMPLLGYVLLAVYQGYQQPASPLLIATAITAPLIALDALLALFQPDGRVTIIWLAIAVINLLLCLIGSFAGAWLQGRNQKI